MDPSTLSSIKLFTEGVLILSPCPRTPESCQNLLVVVVIKAYARARVFALFSRARLDQFYHLSAVFLAAYAASYRDISHYSWYQCNGFCFFLCIVASRRKMYDVASPLKIIRRGWWWWWWLGRGRGWGGGGGGGGRWMGGGGPGHCCSYTIPNTPPTVSFDVCN